MWGHLAFSGTADDVFEGGGARDARECEGVDVVGCY